MFEKWNGGQRLVARAVPSDMFPLKYSVMVSGAEKLPKGVFDHEESFGAMNGHLRGVLGHGRGQRVRGEVHVGHVGG